MAAEVAAVPVVAAAPVVVAQQEAELVVRAQREPAPAAQAPAVVAQRPVPVQQEAVALVLVLVAQAPGPLEVELRRRPVRPEVVPEQVAELAVGQEGAPEPALPRPLHLEAAPGRRVVLVPVQEAVALPVASPIRRRCLRSTPSCGVPPRLIRCMR